MRALRLLLPAAAVALGVFAEWAALRRSPLEVPASGAEIRLAVADFAVGVVLAGVGVLAWMRRPDSATGALLAGCGIAWYLGTFADSGDPAYADVGSVFVTLHRGPLVHALLGYPTGRLERWDERLVVAFAYVASALPGIGDAPATAIALAAGVIVVGAGRAVRVTGPARRARIRAAVGATALAALLSAAALTRLAGAGSSLQGDVLWAYDIGVAAIAIGLALDLVFGRWVRSTVTGLVVDLPEVSAAGPLRRRLADALGDRSLVVGYWLSDRAVYVDDRGREITLPEDDPERRVTFVGADGDRVAVLVHDPAVSADPELLDSVAAAARIALANVRLQAEIQTQLGELEASRRRLLEARDAERGRLERQLHEGAERRLATIAQLLEQGARGDERRLAELQAKLEATRSELREFARGVHPGALGEGGLRLALRQLADRSPVPVEVAAAADRFPPSVEATAYFVCSEALANAVKHARASGVRIDVSPQLGWLVVSITDDGAGGATLAAGSGLRGLADRVHALGGRVTLASPRGEGTRLVAELPLQ